MSGTDMTMGLEADLVVRRDGFELDVQFDVPPGRTLALLGPNGAGKSTAVDALAGIRPLDEGELHLGGRTLDDPVQRIFVPPASRNIGVVFQQYLLFPHLSVLENAAFGLRSQGVDRVSARDSAAKWLARLEIADLSTRKPGDLSGGQAQRVAVARALAGEPRLLLLDEPLAALDVKTRSVLRRLLATHLSEFEGPRLLITHDPTDAFLLADDIAIVEGGRVTQRGTPDEIRRHPRTPYVAAVAGTNLLFGSNRGGRLTLTDSDQSLSTDDTQTVGSVLITIHPRAIALHPEQPHGSPRNTWQTSVTAVEPLGDTTRIEVGTPLPLTVDITPSAASSLALEPGSPIWVAIKATEISVSPA